MKEPWCGFGRWRGGWRGGKGGGRAKQRRLLYPIATLRHVFWVPEPQHQFVAGFGVLGESEPLFGGALGKAKVREGGDDDVEGGAGAGSGSVC